MARSYQLGRRQAAIDGTRRAILAAARELVAAGEAGVTPGAVAKRAGVSRLTVYNRFGSKAGLLRELAIKAHSRPAGEAPGPSDPRDELRQRIADACLLWAADPALFRRLPLVIDFQHDSPYGDRAVAEDVIGAITSFTVFDRLHKDGRRSQAAVVEIL